MPTSSTSLRDEQKALTRRRLIDAAEAVFARKGFHGASVEEIAKEAGATTGAVYSNFAGKEDLFFALFEERIATDFDDYSEIFGSATTVEEGTRRAADHWVEVLRERPHYFPLLIEFWAYAVRVPRLRERLGAHFGVIRSATARMVLDGARQSGLELDEDAGELVAKIINALSHGLALEKLVDPDSVPDALFGDILVVVLQALEAFARQAGAGVGGEGPDTPPGGDHDR